MSTATLPRMSKRQEHIQVIPRKQAGTNAAERVVLTGFMGSGKSTVGTLLAQRLGWSFIDLDAEIERRNGMSVPAIFAALGEARFRTLETSALAAVLGQRYAVIALGGGAPETLGNRLLLEQTPATMVVFLHAPFAVLHQRCVHQATQVRPLLAHPAQAEARYDARLRMYEQIATFRLETGSSCAEEISESIASLFHRPL